jgi:hypothetical protein
VEQNNHKGQREVLFEVLGRYCFMRDLHKPFYPELLLYLEAKVSPNDLENGTPPPSEFLKCKTAVSKRLVWSAREAFCWVERKSILGVLRKPGKQTFCLPLITEAQAGRIAANPGVAQRHPGEAAGRLSPSALN